MSEENQIFQAAARPTSRRQATGVQATMAKKPAHEKETNELSIRNPAVFIKQVVDELREVIWPTGRQMVTYDIIVVLFLVTTIALVWGMDTLTGLGVRLVLSK